MFSVFGLAFQMEMKNKHFSLLFYYTELERFYSQYFKSQYFILIYNIISYMLHRYAEIQYVYYLFIF